MRFAFTFLALFVVVLLMKIGFSFRRGETILTIWQFVTIYVVTMVGSLVLSYRRE